jgi:general secretion pathway protein B
MSFILDALKKSENDRQRQSGPALFEVRVPPPRSKFPLLAIVIVALLVVNVGVVAWLMLRKPAEAAVPSAQAEAAPQATFGAPNAPQATSPPGAPQSAQTQPGYSTPGTQPGGYTTVPGNAPPVAYGDPSGAAPGGYGQQQAPAGYSPPGAPPAGQGGYAPTPAPDPYLAGDAAGLNPDDYEPAQEPTPGQFNGGRASRGTESGLPTYDEVAAKMTMPQLHLDLHSYAPDPSKRFVLINMRRLYEGQTMPEGVKVESITNDSAIMSFNGTKFVLDRD